jgi:hypothetical protein
MKKMNGVLAIFSSFTNGMLLRVAYRFIYQEIAIKHACVRPRYPSMLRPTSGTKHLHLPLVFASNNVNTKKGIQTSKPWKAWANNPDAHRDQTLALEGHGLISQEIYA